MLGYCWERGASYCQERNELHVLMERLSDKEILLYRVRQEIPKTINWSIRVVLGALRVIHTYNMTIIVANCVLLCLRGAIPVSWRLKSWLLTNCMGR